MKSWSRFAGILGLVMMLFGIFGGFIVSFEVGLILWHIVLGVLLIAYWFLTSGLKNIGQTGGALTGRASRYSANVVLYSIVFVSIIVAFNWIGNRGDYIKRWDLTEQSLHSLSDQSIRVLKDLKEPLRIVGFIGKDTGSPYHETVKLYAYYSDKVKVEFVDPNAKPHLIDKYKMKEGNLLYIAYGTEEKILGDSRLNDIKEEEITNAVIKLTRGSAKKLYYVIGHDEPALKGESRNGVKELADALGDEHLEIEELLLANKGAVPDDAAAVILAAPKKAMMAEERDALIKYGDNGGRLILLHDPQLSPTEDIRLIADHYGITVQKDVVLDVVQRLFAGPAVGTQLIARDYTGHAATRGLSEQSPAVFNMASSLSIKEGVDDGATRTELVKTSPNAWGETNLEALFADEPSAEPDQSDRKGPLTIVAAFEKSLTPPKKEGEAPKEDEALPEKFSRVVVFADADFAYNGNFALYSNRDLILNAINWAVGEEGGVSIRPKTARVSMAPIEKNTYLLLLTSSFMVPELILIMGLWIWWRRRAAEA